MKSGKGAGPSGNVVDMHKASGDTGIDLVTQLANSIVNEGVVPADWEVSSKGDTLERGNYMGMVLI